MKRLSNLVPRGAVLARGLIVLLSGCVLGVVGAQASLTTAPAITGVSAFVVSLPQSLTLSGTDFATALPSDDCSLGAPKLHILPLDGGGELMPIAPDAGAGKCKSTNVTFSLPVSSWGSARIWVVDSDGHDSKGSGLQPELTAQPSGTATPPHGQVGGTGVTISGFNIFPKTLASGPAVTFPDNSHGLACSNSAGAITCDGGNASGTYGVSLTVHKDATNLSATQPTSFSAGSFTFDSPQVGGVSPNPATVGQTVTISGANLGNVGGNVTFNGAATAAASWGSSGVTVAVPAGAPTSSSLRLQIPGYGEVAGPTLALNPLATAVSPSSASGGDAVAVTGFNFGGGAGTISIGNTRQTVSAWSDQMARFVLGGDTDIGPLVLTRADGHAVAAPALRIVPKLTALENNNVAPGTAVVVDGVSLGSAIGSAAVAGQAVTPQLWSRTQVVVPLPAALGPGSYPIVLKNAAGAASNPITVTVVPAASANTTPGGGATPRPGSSPGQPTTVGLPTNPLEPSYNVNHEFVKPPKPDGPVNLTITATPNRIAAGKSADIIVTLFLNGKPVDGAEIKLSMIAAPAADYSISPSDGVTGADGVFRASVQISSKTGDNVILAQSGIFSDQDRIVGLGPKSASAVNKAGGGGPPVAVIAIGIVAVGLVALGVSLNFLKIELTG